MNKRIIGLGLTAVAAAALGGCGSGSGSASGSSASPSGTARTAARARGAAGEIVQLQGSTLTLTGPSGDTVVTLGGSTQITKTATGTLASISVGGCVVAAGQKEASGNVGATTVMVRPKGASGTCGGTGRGGGTGTPPSGTPSRSANPNAAFAAGEVTAVNGAVLTVHSAQGDRTVDVQDGARVTVATPAQRSDLTSGSCAVATGPRNSSGTVTASSVSIVPAGPSGCSTGNGLRGHGAGGLPSGGGGAGGGGNG